VYIPTNKARSSPHLNYDTIRYDTRCYFNERSKADTSRLNLTTTIKCRTEKLETDMFRSIGKQSAAST